MGFPKDGYFKMPNVIFGSAQRRGWMEEIGPAGFAVYALILRRYDHRERRGMYESHRSMAKRLGISEPTVEKQLRHLTDLGLIERVPHSRRKHEQVTYVPCLPIPALPEQELGETTNTQSGWVSNTQNDLVKKAGIPKSTRNNTQNDTDAGKLQLFVNEDVKTNSGGHKRLSKRLNMNMSKQEIKQIAANSDAVPVQKQVQAAWRYWCQLWEAHYDSPYYPAHRKDNGQMIPKDKRNLGGKIVAVGFAEVIARMERCFEVCDTIFPCFVNGKWKRPITLNDFVNNRFFDQWIVPATLFNGPTPKKAADKIEAAMEKRCRTADRDEEET
jgi:hypothetical protein